MSLGILGGTFDPPHLGHLNIAQHAIKSGKVDKILFIPTSVPPHKSRKAISSDIHRLEMTKIMVEEYPDISVSDIEIKRKGLSYTILTLKELQGIFPSEKLHLIIGADMALIFDTWKNAEEIIDIAPPLIASRPGYIFKPEFGVTEPSKISVKYRKKLLDGIFKTTLKDISSTELRNAISTNNTILINKYIDSNVLNYITENKLYK